MSLDTVTVHSPHSESGRVLSFEEEEVYLRGLPSELIIAFGVVRRCRSAKVCLDCGSTIEAGSRYADVRQHRLPGEALRFCLTCWETPLVERNTREGHEALHQQILYSASSSHGQD